MRKSRFLLTTAVWILIPLVFLWIAAKEGKAEADRSPLFHTDTEDIYVEITGKLELVTYQTEETTRTFCFCLKAESDSPPPEHTQIRVSGEGTLSFGKIRFSRPGDFRYELYQKQEGRMEDFFYDDRVYEICVRVIRKDSGMLSASVWSTQRGQKTKTEPIFVNRSQPREPGEKKESQEKDTNNSQDNGEIHSGEGRKDGESEGSDGNRRSGNTGNDTVRGSGNPAQTHPVQTGDDTHTVLFRGLFAGSGSFFLMLLWSKKRKRQR